MKGSNLADEIKRHPWRAIDLAMLFILQPIMAVLAGFVLLSPHRSIAHPMLFWVWIAVLFLILAETIYSFGHAHYRGRTRVFMAKLVLAATTTILSYAAVYRVFGLVDQQGNIHHGITEAIYFSLITWTTIGYGDFLPTPEARLIAGSEGLLGYIYMATIVGLLMVEISVRRTR